MNRKYSSKIILLLIVLVASGLSAALIIKSTGKGAEKNVGSRKGAVRIQMSWWGNDGRHMYTMEGVDLFKEAHPDIEVSYRYGEWNGYEKRTQVWMESHTEADVMQINYAWLNVYSPDGSGFYDLNELADYIDLDNFTEEEKAYGTMNGKLNALPIAMNSHVFYYNQDVLDAYGLSVPQSWDDLFAMAKVLAPDDIYVLGTNKKQVFLLLIAYYEQRSGKQMFNEDGTLAIDEKGLADMLSFYKRLIDEKVLCPIDTFDRADYMSGKIAGTMCWISDTKIYCDGLAEKGVNVSRGSFPRIPDAVLSGWYTKPATMWAISKDTKNPREAAMLLNFLLNDPDMAMLQKNEKGVPVSDAAVSALMTEGLAETNEYKAAMDISEKQADLQLIIPNMENESIIDAFKSEADEYLFGKMSLEDCAKETRKTIESIIAEK